MLIKSSYWKIREKIRDAFRRYYRRLQALYQGMARMARDVSEQLFVLQQLVRLRFAGRKRQARTTAPKRSILVVSYFSPPYRGAYGTQRINKFMKFLTRWGWDVALLTTEPSMPEEQDVQSETVCPCVHVARLPAPAPLTAISWNDITVPDGFIQWIRPAIARAQSLIRERDISVVLATAPPYSNLVIGSICASQCRLPFIPDYRDPWSMMNTPPWHITKPGLRQLNQWMEKTVLESSAKVIITDDIKYLDDYLPISDVIRSRTTSITNGFDEEDFQGLPEPDPRRKFTVSYIGSLYGQETFDLLLQPFRIWRQAHPDDLLDVEFVYAGSQSYYFHRTGALPFILRDAGYVTHRQALLLRMDSDLQLFAQPRHFKPHFYSGKIFEMLRAGIPILAVTRPDGAVANLLLETNAGFTAAQERPEQAAAILKIQFDKWRRGEHWEKPDMNLVQRWSREALAQRLAAILEETIGIR